MRIYVIVEEDCAETRGVVRHSRQLDGRFLALLHPTQVGHRLASEFKAARDAVTADLNRIRTAGPPPGSLP